MNIKEAKLYSLRFTTKIIYLGEQNIGTTIGFRNMEGLLKTERKILKNIYGPKKLEGSSRIRHNWELYKRGEDIETAMRKRRLKFFGHMVRMDKNRINNQIFDKVIGLKNLTGYPEQVKVQMAKLGTANEDCLERVRFQKHANKMKV